MAAENLFVLNPYDEDIIKKVTEFEEQNNIKQTVIKKAEEIKKKYTEKEYEELKKERNEIKEVLFLTKKGKIIDTAYLEGVKDISKCTITFPKMNEKKRKIVDLSMDYAFNVLDLKEVFISSNGDMNLESQLIQDGFEFLGENNGQITYLKEKSEEKKIERAK